MTSKIKRNKLGFTLLELITVMAIIGILATAIMVSLSKQKERARANKVLLELSGVMNKIYLCISDDGVPQLPNGNSDICNLNSQYGTWPSLNGTDFSYDNGTNFSSDPWKYSASNSQTNTVICCNSTSGKCQKKEGVGLTCNPAEHLN